jgi:hypothetical protein
VLLGSQCEGIQVDTGIGSTSVVLPRLNEVEVGSFALREAILAVKLELGSDHGVLTPAVHVERSLGQNEGAGIRDTGVHATVKVGQVVWLALIARVPPRCVGGVNILSTGVVEETGGIDVRTGGSSDGIPRAESHNGIGEGIDSVGVIEGLSAEKTVENSSIVKRRAVVDILVGLDDPDELLNGVVKVELDLVGRGTNGLITSELELLNEVLVGVLGHTPALVGVQEDVVNVERSSDERLVVSGGHLGGGGGAVEGVHGPQALLNRADIKVDLDLVVLKGDEGKGQTGVAAEPELKGNIEGSLRKSIAGSANLARSGSIARTVDVVEGGVGYEGKLGSVTDHLEITALLLGRHSELVPDVHPITVLAIDTLATDLNLHLGDELLTGEVEPTGINATGRSLERLTDLGESHLKVGAVSQITVAGDGAGHTATEVSLAIESLLNRLHCEVSVTLVGNLPESDLGIASQVNVLCAVGDKLHKSSTHCLKLLVILFKKKKKIRK